MTLEDWPVDPVSEAAALIEEGRAAQAAARLSALIREGRGGLLARLTLARALLADARAAEAVSAARELTQLAPGWADAAVVLGQAFAANDALPVAIAEYQRALRLDRDCGAAELGLAEAWAAAGEADRAEAHLATAIRLGESGAALEARIAALRGAARSDGGYIRHLFDQFAGDYDERMRGNLGYRAPEILRDLGALVSGGKLHKVATLDLGCGTGLAAPIFEPLATRLVGIDLSPQMIAQANAGGLYDALEVGDIEAYMAETKLRFGRVIAADVLVYLGDLRAVFAGVRRVLKPGGLVLFTVERHEGEADFVLQETKRWAHRRGYIETLAVEHGLDLRGLMDCTPRYNKGVPVPGLAGALAAPS